MSVTASPVSLASWSDGAVKSQILDFVARVTEQSGPDFVPPAERIAVFDNDGTLWCERPLFVQAFFLIDRVRELAAKDPALKVRQPFKALLEYDLKTLLGLGKQAIFELVFVTHSGMRVEEFDPIAQNWLARAMHPDLGRLFKDCTYRPQLDLLNLLKQHGFKSYIVSAGGIDFMRACSEEIYDLPREQVIGSSSKVRFEVHDDRSGLMKLAELNSFGDGEAKPANIALHIGRRPILAFGNSDGDLPMLRYTTTSKGPSLALLLHHDDADREFAYDRENLLSPLNEALEKAHDYGITSVSMKRDWTVIFSKRL
jgi:haloacid dehalogenase-like hydrolase